MKTRNVDAISIVDRKNKFLVHSTYTLMLIGSPGFARICQGTIECGACAQVGALISRALRLIARAGSP